MRVRVRRVPLLRAVEVHQITAHQRPIGRKGIRSLAHDGVAVVEQFLGLCVIAETGECCAFDACGERSRKVSRR